MDEADADCEKNILTIRQTRMVEPNVGVYEDTPKTLRSKRRVSIPPSVSKDILALEAYNAARKELLGDVWKDSPALLKSPTGGPIYPQSIYRYFKRLQRKNGLKDLPLHGLRHTHVSMLTSLPNASIDEISKRVGHSQKSTTMNIYSHLFEDTDSALADELEAKYLRK